MTIEGMIVGGMLFCALFPFWLLTRLMRVGQSGFAVSIAAVTGAVLAVFIFAGGGTFGIDPVVAMAIAMLVCMPALLGCLSGLLLGWLLRKRDDRAV